MASLLVEEVARVLAASGWSVGEVDDAGRECGLDILVSRREWGKQTRSGVICIAGDVPAGLSEVRAVWRRGGPLIRSGAVRELLVVSAHGLDAEALAFAGETPDLLVQSIAELYGAIMDFSQYRAQLQASYLQSADGLPEYYVPPRTTTGLDLADVVHRWIAGRGDSADDVPEGRPIAILGAYGIGKSSFAMSFAAELARTPGRTPVLIRLGEIAGEQSLEGLLGKHFTATYPVTGYRFDLFQSFNAAGGFVIILDGFDEMKQLLTWREFKYNLDQLNRLCVGLAKVILLGRPTAFESEDQQRYALHGTQPTDGAMLIDRDRPDYVELEIAPLNDEQMSLFLSGYLAFRNSGVATDPAAMRALRRKIESPQLHGIARRPVQLRMLADILPSYRGKWEDLDLALLYAVFIDQLIGEVIQREESKSSRLAFSEDERRRFLAGFAFWLWTTRTTTAEADHLPDHLFQPFLKGDDLEATRRDLIAGSPLDRRAGERIRFPHRSFQEFLVAEQIWDGLMQGSLDVAEADRLITRDVSRFMRLQRRRTHIAATMKIIPELRGQYHWHLIDALFLEESVISGIYEKVQRKRDARPLTAWELLLAMAWTTKTGTAEFLVKPDQIAAIASRSNESRLHLLALFCVMRLAAEGMRNDAAEFTILKALVDGKTLAERFSAERIEHKAVVALDERTVAAVRHKSVVVGRYVGRGRIATEGRKQYVVGRDHVEVQWYTPEAVGLARSLGVRKGGRQLSLHGVHAMMAALLPETAFFSDWLNGRGTGFSVPVQDGLDLSSPSAVEFMAIRDEVLGAISLAEVFASRSGATGVARAGPGGPV